jgi:hypothetical protein
MLVLVRTLDGSRHLRRFRLSYEDDIINVVNKAN